MSKLALVGTRKPASSTQHLGDVCSYENCGKTFKVVQADNSPEEGTILLIAVDDTRCFPIELWPNPGAIWGISATVVDVDVELVIP